MSLRTHKIGNLSKGTEVSKFTNFHSFFFLVKGLSWEGVDGRRAVGVTPPKWKSGDKQASKVERNSLGKVRSEERE